ncbi:MAG TPA: DUF4249 domain-containing protein, partial [Puia sp.]|nr:DUF4249 domain-containing protein [Puia sp.]
MIDRLKKYFLLTVFVSWIVASNSCKEQYNPPAIQAAPHYLVVDGFLNAGPGNTMIYLSRTRGLQDSLSSSLEVGAQVVVEGEAGDQYNLLDLGNGTYMASSLNLVNTEQYRLSIRTSDGKQYASDFVPVLLSPPIDSITWSQNTDVHIYANTHDPNGNTKYYRWVYEETWAYSTY